MIDLNELTLEQRHIETLRRHGAMIRNPEGKPVELNMCISAKHRVYWYHSVQL